jgi:hypothetical protein
MKRIILALFLCLLLASPAAALTLAWDAYTDPNGTNLRIYHSADNTNFTILVDAIPINNVAAEFPDGPDYTRIYYKMTAYNTEDESSPSNTVSFMWSTGGGGSEGLLPMDTIRLMDCDTILQDPNHADYTLCQGRYIP